MILYLLICYIVSDISICNIIITEMPLSVENLFEWVKCSHNSDKPYLFSSVNDFRLTSGSRIMQCYVVNSFSSTIIPSEVWQWVEMVWRYWPRPEWWGCIRLHTPVAGRENGGLSVTLQHWPCCVVCDSDNQWQYVLLWQSRHDDIVTRATTLSSCHCCHAQVLGVLSQDGIMRFIRIDSCKLIFDVGSLDKRILNVSVSSTRRIVAVMDNGDVNVYSTEALTDDLTRVSWMSLVSSGYCAYIFVSYCSNTVCTI